VAILHWPDQHDESVRLEQLGLPRLLVVDADTIAPDIASCLEDWIRLPATEEDVHVRLSALGRRAARHPTTPVIESWGLSFRDAHVFLAPREHAIAEVLASQFATAVSEDDLLERAWPEQDGTTTALRVYVARLRKGLAPLGLTIKNIRGYGYMMRQVPQ
jgi:two-component system OmpR family response regulator